MIARSRRAWNAVRRALASVRVRVALVAAGVFAVTLVIASVMLLRALEAELVGDIRRADEMALHARALSVARDGLGDAAGSTDAVPVGAGGQVAYRMERPGGVIVVTLPGPVAAGTSEIVGPPSDAVDTDAVYTDAVVGEDEIGRPFTLPIDRQSAELLGIVAPGGPFLVSTLHLQGGVSLATASSLAAVEHTLDTTRAALWVAVPALVLLVAALAWLVVGRALRPVHAVTSRVAAISSTSLHERVPVPVVADEVGELATTMNSMLDRLETSTKVNRQLVSDASHELRTPIAVMRAELEVARLDPDADWDAVSTGLLGEVDRLQSLVDDLLLMAQMAERPRSIEDVALDRVVHDAASRRRRVPVRAVGLEDVAPDAMTIDAHAAAVQRAVDHVVANAARHAASAVEARVVDDGAGGVSVVVDDDGPGIPVADRARVLERFVRLDEARSRDAGGSGLGLAVAAEVMRVHGGSIEIGTSASGGARVELRFPARTSSQPLGTVSGHDRRGRRARD